MPYRFASRLNPSLSTHMSVVGPAFEGISHGVVEIIQLVIMPLLLGGPHCVEVFSIILIVNYNVSVGPLWMAIWCLHLAGPDEALHNRDLHRCRIAELDAFVVVLHLVGFPDGNFDPA